MGYGGRRPCRINACESPSCSNVVADSGSSVASLSMMFRQFQMTLGGHCGVIQVSDLLQAVLSSPLSVMFDVRVETTAPEQNEQKRSKDEVLCMETMLGSQAVYTCPIRHTGLRRPEQRVYK